MTATVHIVTGPSGSGKTRRLLDRYRAVAAEGIATALWLGPTQRDIEQVRQRLLDSRQTLLAPQLCSIQGFADEIIRVHDPVARPLSAVQRRLLIDGLLAELHERGRLKYFRQVVETRGFADGVSALLQELRRHDVQPEEFLRAAARPKDRECGRIYARYVQLLRQNHLLDVEGRPAHARDLLRQGARRPFERVRAVFVDGFVSFMPTQHELLGAVAEGAEELWISLVDDPDDERVELFTTTRSTLAAWQPWSPLVERLEREGARTPPARDGFLPFGDPDQATSRPAGLAHLERQLFRPMRAVVTSGDADGLLLLEAPGVLGEVRMVARQIKMLLLDGAPAEDILVTLRDALPYADLLREVLAEYGIPVDVEGTEPLLRDPAVAALLRALRLPDDDWPFAGVTALLRSGYFRPDWPEVRDDADVAQHAEVLLRLLGEPRHRAAYLEAVRRWVDDPPAGLEDEQAEESRRAHTHELARRCQAFLRRFFCAWDTAPQQGTLAEHISWLRSFAADLGIAREAVSSLVPRERGVGGEGRNAWQRLHRELDQWLEIEQHIHGAGKPLRRREFQRRLHALAAETGLARTPRGPGRVRMLSAPLVRTLDVLYLFVMGLGERSFPRLAAAEPIFDEQERQSFQQAGLDLPGVSEMLPQEMLLFYQVVTRARRRLVLSYPAVDDKGQALLPSSFLSFVRDCFTPDALPAERRSMLIEGHQRDTPLSPAEHRVRVASHHAEGRLGAAGLPADLAANLADAASLVRRRFHDRDHNPYDGMFRDPSVIAAVGELLGPEKVFSPTALEDYIACPFRFFLGHVLHLETLEEPREEIEVTRRGQAFHRALSRLHTQLQAAEVHQPSEVVEEQLLAHLHKAVEEYAVRAPSPASRTLWRLEGQRLARVGTRYRHHWEKFVAPWREVAVMPRPFLFEVDFGLPTRDGQPPAGPLVIRGDGVEVRISGRIDRVDIAEWEQGVGFWIIDYKTGRSSHYTGTDLQQFRRLQLTLYALAVEEVLLRERQARPLGLAYWLVAENGPKIALPGKGALTWFQETERWRAVREQLQQWVATLAANIRQGAFALRPRSEQCTLTCDFAEICRINQSRWVEKTWDLPLPNQDADISASED